MAAPRLVKHTLLVWFFSIGVALSIALVGCGRDSTTTCEDEAVNGEETDVDCGGLECGACASGLSCVVPDDCLSGVCSDNACGVASCDDGVQNGDESDVDCGGGCPPCADALGCSENSDCENGVCVGGACAPATCSDEVLNDAETDVDCGGATCPACAPGEACQGNDDCESDICQFDGTCAAPECGDGVINGSETCDDGVETEMCDADCTVAECGDGIANTALGEPCDGDGLGSGGETAACDSDCTVAECGDGNVNTTFGETCDGDGLGAGGETASCDLDCTVAQCDDLVINETAGEECADGNLIPGDGCDAECLLERTLFSTDCNEAGECPGSCTEWQAFQTEVASSSQTWSTVTIRGSEDPVGVSCTGAAANTLCDALGSGSAVSNLACDGRTWNVGDCGGTEINAQGNGVCQCTNPGYTVRPCIGSTVWGGINTDTCNSSAQTVEVFCS